MFPVVLFTIGFLEFFGGLWCYPYLAKFDRGWIVSRIFFTIPIITLLIANRLLFTKKYYRYQCVNDISLVILHAILCIGTLDLAKNKNEELMVDTFFIFLYFAFVTVFLLADVIYCLVNIFRKSRRNSL